jgi:hypothetical protein
MFDDIISGKTCGTCMYWQKPNTKKFRTIKEVGSCTNEIMLENITDFITHITSTCNCWERK